MKLGTIGTSWITDKFLDAVSRVEGIELKAIYSRTKEKAIEFGMKHAINEYYTNLLEMANNSEIDIVYIASPNVFHVEQALIFIRKGIHVIIEKPIALDYESLKILYEEGDKNKVFIFEAIRPIHHPHMNILKNEVEKMRRITYAYFHFMRYDSKYIDFKNGKEIPVFSTKYGGGALYDVGIYPIYNAVYLFGLPKDYKIFSNKLSSGVDAVSSIILIYDSFTCVIGASKISTSKLKNEIQGEEITITIDNISRLSEIKLYTEDIVETLIDKKIDNDMVYELKNFIHIINNNDIDKYKVYQNLSLEIGKILESLRKQAYIKYL